MSQPPIGEEPVEVQGWATAPVAGGRVDVHQGPIVAGDPDGARVEVTGDGLHAYDSEGVETAHIRGEGGEFVGGSFRTSDALSGQVTLADDAYVSSFDGVARPGISVEPEDAARFAILPGIGPEPVGMTIDGGKLTTGESSHIKMYPDATAIRTRRADGTTGGAIQTSPTESLMRTYRENGTVGGGVQTSQTGSFIFTNREDGTTAGEIATLPASSFMQTYREDGTVGGAIQTTPTLSTMRTYSGNSSEKGWVQVQTQDAELAYVDANNTYFSRIKADASEAFLFTRAGGTNRYLTVDADGIWVRSGSKAYNLEETAQDSGWIALSYASGFASAGSGGPFQIRRMGGMVHLRGRVARTSGAIVAGTQYTVGTLSSSWRPAYTQRTLIAGGGSSQWGRIEVSAITGEISIAAISGDMDWVDLSGTLWTADLRIIP